MSLELFVAIVALVNVAVVIEFVRRRSLTETFALLWIAVGVGGVVFAVARPLIDDLAEAVGVRYGASLIFGLALLFLLFVAMSLSLNVSRLHAQVEVLAEEVAFLRGVSSPSEVEPVEQHAEAGNVQHRHRGRRDPE
jgi:hypothetical protein